MVSNGNWNISYCAGYIVPSCKNQDIDNTKKQIVGSSFNLSGEMYDYFYPRFAESFDTCSVQIGFTPAEDGEQQNEIRDIIRDLAFGSKEEKDKMSLKLAVQLGLASDKRSPLGLLIVLTGTQNAEARVVLFKFPADESIQATFAQEGLTMNIVDGAFSQRGDYFKAAVFQDNGADTGFWEGWVEDKQASQRVYEVSDLWVIGFLKSLPYLTDSRGSRLLAKCLRKVIDNTKEPALQHELVAAAITIKSQSDRRITLRDFSENYLPAEAREQFLKEVKNVLLTEAPFNIERTVLEEQLAVKTLVLDNQFSVIGPLERFDDPNYISIQYADDDDEVVISLRGQVVSERLKTTRSLPKGS